MNTLDNPITEMLQAYRDAVLRKDAAAFAALYAPQVQVFDAWDSWQQRGRKAVLAMAEAWFGALGENTVEVAISELDTHLGADVAAASALATYTAVAPDGTRLRAQTNRLSLVLARSGPGWHVVHQHTSVPVGFASRQAMPSPHMSGDA